MLVKFDAYLVYRILNTAEEKSQEPPQMAVVVTENGITKIPFSKKHWIESAVIAEMTPEWLKTALMEGNTVSMSRSDFDSIPLEIQQYGETLSND